MNVLLVNERYVENKNVIDNLKKKIKDEIKNVNIEVCIENSKINEKYLKGTDLLITFNLTGFEQSTLAGGISYNLLNCKQIHFLLDRNLPNESYLSKQLSLSMFFFCFGNDYYQYLLDTYPDIPYLELIASKKMVDKMNVGFVNVDVLWLSICKVLEKCKLLDVI